MIGSILSQNGYGNLSFYWKKKDLFSLFQFFIIQIYWLHLVNNQNIIHLRHSIILALKNSLNYEHLHKLYRCFGRWIISFWRPFWPIFRLPDVRFREEVWAVWLEDYRVSSWCCLLFSIKHWMGPYKRTPISCLIYWILRVSGEGSVQCGPVGDFLDICHLQKIMFKSLHSIHVLHLQIYYYDVSQRTKSRIKSGFHVPVFSPPMNEKNVSQYGPSLP